LLLLLLMRSSYLRQKKLRWALALLMVAGPPSALAPAAFAQRSLPDLGDSATAAVSPAAERRLGDSIARDIRKDPDWLDDPTLDDYIQGMFQTLLATARASGEVSAGIDDRFAWQPMLIADRTVNAFALPGGYFGFHAGLISITQSRDELASVVAHEITHVTQRHIARMIGQSGNQTLVAIAGAVLGALAARSNPQAAGGLLMGSQALAIQQQLNFSRDMEREADRIGYGVLVQSGFAPQAMGQMFERLQAASRLSDSGAFPYLRSHPLNTERLADAQTRARQDAAVNRDVPTLAHAQMVGRALVYTDTSLQARQARVVTARTALADGAGVPGSRQTPFSRMALLYAGAASAVLLKDWAAADALLDGMRAAVTREPMAQRQWGQLLVERLVAEGRPEQARQALAVLSALPEVPSGLLAQPRRAETLLRAEAQWLAGQRDASLQTLQLRVAEQTGDSRAWQMLAKAWDGSAQPLRAVRAQAEARFAEGDLAGALDRLQAGRRLMSTSAAMATGADFIEASIIDARAREVERLIAEEARADRLR
jgi:predicted Zn-dependent protease